MSTEPQAPKARRRNPARTASRQDEQKVKVTLYVTADLAKRFAVHATYTDVDRRGCIGRTSSLTVSLPSARDLVALGVDHERIAVVRNGLDEAPRERCPGRAPPRPEWSCSRGSCHTSRSRMRWKPSRSCANIQALHLEIVGDGWWRQRLVDHVQRLAAAMAAAGGGA